MGNKRQQKKGSKKSPDEIPDEGDEAVEITAHIALPKEGGWGWVVVVASCLTLAIIDGISFTYGSVLNAIARDLKISTTLSSLINSLMVLFYFSAGPIVAALINRFGFRACTMFGSILSSFSICFCYFIDSYALLCLFYGVLAGFGLCCIQMSATLIVGFYFEKLRSLVLSLTMSGSCIGVIIFSPTNTYIANTCSWRTVFIMQSGFLGICYFLAMTFRPLLSVTVVTVIDDHLSRSTIVLPSTSKQQGVLKGSQSKRLFSSVSNKNFPTAAQIATEQKLTPETTAESSAVTSKRSVSKIVLRPTSEVSKMQLKQLEVIKTDIKRKARELWIDVEKQEEEVENERVRTKRGLCDLCCPWESHVSEQRPMYRDDVFYEGSIKNLPIYQSMANIPENEKTGLEYQLAVSRAATLKDLKENKGFFPASVRRVLATMLDVSLLKRWSFFLICLNGFLAYMGFIIPFMFSVNKAIANGLDPEKSQFLVSNMNVSILIGRLLFCYLGDKSDPVVLFIICEVACGVLLILSNLYYSLWYQYLILFVYGLFGSTLPALRSIVLLKLYGIEKLTNAMGLKLVLCGIGCSVGAPFCMIVNDLTGKSVEFYLGGIFMIIAGLTMIPAPRLAKKENSKIVEKEIEITKIIDPDMKISKTKET